MVKVNLNICAALILGRAWLAPVAGADTWPSDAPEDIRLELSQAHAGNVDSMYLVATYLADQAIEDDAMASFAWLGALRRATAAQAAELTGVMYRGGIGVPQNYVKSRKWFERARRGGRWNRISNWRSSMLMRKTPAWTRSSRPDI